MPNPLRWIVTALALAVCVLAVTATPVAAENAQQIFENAMERYEKRLASIESITIVQEVMGVEIKSRLEKVMIEDRPVLVPKGAGRAGDLGPMYRHFDSMAKKAKLKGTEKVDGHACWAIHVTDLDGMQVPAEGADDFQSTDGTFYVDKEGLMVRRMLMNGVAKRDGVERPVKMDMHLKDYREVDGWLHPFVTEVNVEGAADAAEMVEMRKAMAEMEKQLAEMPAEQREMVEKMMKERMPKIAAGADGGAMTVTMIVKELRVNEPEE